MIPEEAKKKTELIQATVAPGTEKISAPLEQSNVGVSRESEREIEPTDDELLVQEESSFPQGIEHSLEDAEALLDQSNQISSSMEMEDDAPRQILDREKIEEKIADLPNGIRAVLEEKFKADFVSIEKIDETKLI